MLQKTESDGTRISLSDVEDRLRALSGGAREVLVDSKQGALLGGAAGAFVLIAGSYLLGRRRGRRRATILEIHRA
jgi:hypothetical protein